MVFIDPYMNHTAGCTGASGSLRAWARMSAWPLAIAFNGLTEGTYDKEYIALRTTGFDEWKSYVLGGKRRRAEDAGWAQSGIRDRGSRHPRAGSGVRASKNDQDLRQQTAPWAAPAGPSEGNEGTRSHGPRSPQWQGMGKRASNIWPPPNRRAGGLRLHVSGLRRGGISGDGDNFGAGYRWSTGCSRKAEPTRNSATLYEGQTVPRLRIPEAILQEHLGVRGKGFCAARPSSPSSEVRISGPRYPNIGITPLWGLFFR